MDHTYEDLKKKTVEELREIAAGLEHEAVQGHTQMNKEHLLPALCKALGIDTHAHHEVKGVNKGKIKTQIKELKGKRDEALAAKDPGKLKHIRRQIRSLKRQIRKAMV